MSTAYSSAKQQYIGNGVTTEWGFDFPIQKHSELKVYLKRSGQTQVLLEEGVDYSFVTENTIAFPIKTGEAKLQATDVLALQRESVFESEYNFSNQQRLEPEEVMHADDNLERQIQELKRDVTQAIRIQPTSNINTDEYFIAVESIYENLDNINNVSGISAEIVNCSDNISDISAVSSNIANVNAVGQSISNVNTVASDISSVNTVAGVSTDVTTVAGISTGVSTVANNSANITTVATNISDVNTAATNIEAIQAAPTAANNAAQSATNAANSATASANSATASATSANNSHIWAEGTDAQVQALGGVHSSKGWAEQSTNANIALTNSPYTTNRILEIPQDIKLELNNGTLTLKAGSKIYVPNGFEADGTTHKFDEVVVASDVQLLASLTSTYVNGNYSWFYNKDLNKIQGGNNVLNQIQSNTYDNSAQYCMFYDTTNNIIKYTKDYGATWKTGYSLCFCITELTNGVGNVSIDQVFNGFGYIGSTVFALPGVKVQGAFGVNEDGTYKLKTFITDHVLTWSFGADVYGRYEFGFDVIENGTITYFGTYTEEIKVGEKQPSGVNFSWWNPIRGETHYVNFSGIDEEIPHCPSRLGRVNVSGGKIDSMTRNQTDSIVTSNALNFSQSGRSYLSGLGMPSNRYIDLTLGASGQTYTAPANGYFDLDKQCTASGQYVQIARGTAWLSDTSLATSFVATGAQEGVMHVPVKKGDTIFVRYTATGATTYFRFIYAEGEN